MKAHQIAAVVRELPALFGPDTIVLTAQNGIPFWYFLKHGGEHEGKILESVDPGGVVADAIRAERIIGSVVYPAAETIAPGVIRHIEGNRFSISEIDGATYAARARGLGDLAQGRLQGAGVVRHPRRDLDEAVGQPDLQSDQRADARDARGPLPLSAHP